MKISEVLFIVDNVFKDTTILEELKDVSLLIKIVYDIKNTLDYAIDANMGILHKIINVF